MLYRNQSIDLQSKSINWFLYDNGLHHERIKGIKVAAPSEDFAMHGFDIRSLPSSVLCAEKRTLPRKEKKPTQRQEDDNISIV